MPTFFQKNVQSLKETVLTCQFLQICREIYLPVLSCHAHIWTKQRQIFQNYTILWAKKVNRIPLFFPNFHEWSWRRCGGSAGVEVEEELEVDVKVEVEVKGKKKKREKNKRKKEKEKKKKKKKKSHQYPNRVSSSVVLGSRQPRQLVLTDGWVMVMGDG